MPRVLKAPPKIAVAATVYALALVLALYCTGLLVDFFTRR
jgi:hypothetical protein